MSGTALAAGDSVDPRAARTGGVTPLRSDDTDPGKTLVSYYSAVSIADEDSSAAVEGVCNKPEAQAKAGSPFACASGL